MPEVDEAEVIYLTRKLCLLVEEHPRDMAVGVLCGAMIIQLGRYEGNFERLCMLHHAMQIITKNLDLPQPHDLAES